MKTRLLISTAVLALTAGFAFAQNPAQAPQQSAPAQQSAPQQAPAARPGAGEDLKGDRPQRTDELRNPGTRAQNPRSQPQEEQGQPRTGQATGTPKAQEPKGQEKAQDRSKPNATTGQGAGGASGASLTSEQRTKISTSIRQSHVRPASNVNFNISVGTVVPRNITLHPLPASVIEVYPDWRAYRFILVGDEIVVIEPGSHRIVAVLPA